MVLISMAACTTTRYVPVESVKTEYIRHDSIRVDSTFVHDSIFVQQKGDTIYKDKYKYIYKYMFLTKTDTVLKVDTIAQIVEVEKKLTKWQQWKLDVGGGATIAVAILLIGLIVYLIKRFI